MLTMEAFGGAPVTFPPVGASVRGLFIWGLRLLRMVVNSVALPDTVRPLDYDYSVLHCGTVLRARSPGMLTRVFV